ncbi:hypothetical protein DFH08DRAFT_864284 [Mycena albidolilacea]|uniref:Uncharacterized protein n=1 Tax=Mycena albidolilacea TaxID=1033008 RepID=A0AAD7A402_9AGAR|nr:hypothetical protein DFH08DRAFT_864284 [Mycena albidolilacea]
MATKPSGLGLEIVSTINKLQDVFTTVGSSATPIDLPQIWCQSWQASCSLYTVKFAENSPSTHSQNIAGRDFLPLLAW